MTKNRIRFIIHRYLVATIMYLLCTIMYYGMLSPMNEN
jgi:hypothetical protein